MKYYVSEGGSVHSPLLAQHDEETHWFHSDALGSTLGLTNDAGSLSDTFLYEAFGTSLGRTGTTVTPYQHVGAAGWYAKTALEECLADDVL
ncbi:MAG: hypothetical protein KKI08_25595 [Armatimonadetes bacterium]|nr:hypothetical protein [Armatimonadota bacterium]